MTNFSEQICVVFQGVGGTVQFPKDFLKRAYEIIRQHGGICIADEVRNNNLNLIKNIYSLIPSP